MATIKSYSDLQQSKKLAEILPLESADMFYMFESINGEQHYHPIIITEHANRNFIIYEHNSGKGVVSWSLAALLDILDYPQLSKDKLGSGKEGWMVSVYPNDCRYDSCWHDNPVDACVAMIEKLNELNLL